MDPPEVEIEVSSSETRGASPTAAGTTGPRARPGRVRYVVPAWAAVLVALWIGHEGYQLWEPAGHAMCPVAVETANSGRTLVTIRGGQDAREVDIRGVGDVPCSWTLVDILDVAGRPLRTVRLQLREDRVTTIVLPETPNE